MTDAYGAIEWPQPIAPRSGKCDCGGALLWNQAPKDGIAWALICDSCGKYRRWEMEPTKEPWLARTGWLLALLAIVAVIAAWVWLLVWLVETVSG